MNKKIKVVELLPYLGVGGAETFVFELCKAFDKEKTDIYLVTMRDYVDEKYESIKSNNSVHFVSLGKKSGFNLGFGKKLKKCIQAINPDIIHVHINCVFYAAKYLRQLKKPIVFTLHSLPKTDNRTLFRLYIKRYIRNGTITPVGISKNISELTCEEYKINDCTTINNGIEIINYKLLNQKEFDFISVGRLVSAKNYPLLLASLAEVKKSYQNIKLCLVGYGELETKIRETISELSLNENVSLITSCKKPYEYMLKSKCFVSSSIYEGSPITILEAYECGLPIIATKVGGVPDSVQNGINGILVNSNDKQALVDAMLDSLKNDDKYQKIGTYNKENVFKFDIKNTAKEYLTLFEKLLK